MNVAYFKTAEYLLGRSFRNQHGEQFTVSGVQPGADRARLCLTNKGYRMRNVGLTALAHEIARGGVTEDGGPKDPTPIKLSTGYYRRP